MAAGYFKIDRHDCARPLLPQWVKSATLTARRSLPVFPYEQTSAAPVGMSQRCQFRPHAPQQTASLFDHLVGAGEEYARHGQTERFGGFEIDD
jgi:hypothetical protein